MSAPLSGDLAQIGKSVVIKGELSGSEDLYVDGQVEGSISLKGNSLTVGPNGQVKASVEPKVWLCRESWKVTCKPAIEWNCAKPPWSPAIFRRSVFPLKKAPI